MHSNVPVDPFGGRCSILVVYRESSSLNIYMKCFHNSMFLLLFLSLVQRATDEKDEKDHFTFSAKIFFFKISIKNVSKVYVRMSRLFNRIKLYFIFLYISTFHIFIILKLLPADPAFCRLDYTSTGSKVSPVVRGP